MNATIEFSVFDCSLARCATGRSSSNLRELLDAVRSVSDAVLEHHVVRCTLDDHFGLYEFPNDLARWCWRTLGDQALGEELALVDPYRFSGIEALRASLCDVIEERLWGVERVASCPRGSELHWVESRLVAFDTGERIATPAALAEAIPKMPVRSLFYHVHEARRRTGGKTDDFSLWLETIGANASLIAGLRAIDFYFLNLAQLRDELTAVFQRHLGEMLPAVTEKP